MLPPISGVFELEEVPRRRNVHNILHRIDVLQDQVLADHELGIHPGRVVPVSYGYERQKMENQRRRGQRPVNPFDEVPVLSGLFL